MKKCRPCPSSGVLASALFCRSLCHCPQVDPLVNTPLHPLHPFPTWESDLNLLSGGSISQQLSQHGISTCRATTPTCGRIQKTTSRHSFPPRDCSLRGQCYQRPRWLWAVGLSPQTAPKTTGISARPTLLSFPQSGCNYHPHIWVCSFANFSVLSRLLRGYYQSSDSHPPATWNWDWAINYRAKCVDM